MKDLEEKFYDNEEILNIVNEIKKLPKEDKYKNDSIKDLKKNYPQENKKLEETLLIYMGENDLKIIKTDFFDKWKHLNKE